MFKDALWESHCYGSNKLINILMFIPLIIILAVPFTIHFFGFGVIAIILLIIFVVTITIFLLIARKRKWVNPKLIFAFTEVGIFFTSMQNPSSYFSDEYSNMSGYDYVKEENNLTTVTIFFIVPSNAGVFGNLKSLKMVKIQNFDKLKAVLESKNIPRTIKDTKPQQV